MEFDEAALAPTYRLLWGIPGRSNAINIAARLGLDPAVISAARERLGAAEVSPPCVSSTCSRVPLCYVRHLPSPACGSDGFECS